MIPTLERLFPGEFEDRQQQVEADFEAISDGLSG